MKIYIENFNIKNIKNLNNIDKYLYKQYYQLFLYTKNNICKIINNNIYTLNIIDKDIEYYKLDDLNLLIDKSYYKTNYIIYSIPIDHTFEKIHIKEYKFHNISNFKLIIEFKNNTIYDFYFYTSHSDYIDFFNSKYIVSFLSLLTNI